jgi:UDP-3-O-[3-hydroxymyristoyl] glucosamine N-acyltransferase
MKEVVIFGDKELAEIAYFYLTHDSDHKVAAFTVDQQYLKNDTLEGLPVVAFEEVQEIYPPSYVSTKATIWPGLKVGENCFIYENNVIQPYVEIGNNVILWSGNHIGHHSIIDDHCFLASHIVVSGGVHIEPYCFIGINATLRDHITIGSHSLIGAGALIMKDTDPRSVYTGQDARKAAVTSDKLRKI